MEKPVDSFGSGMPFAAKFHAAHARHAARNQTAAARLQPIQDAATMQKTLVEVRQHAQTKKARQPKDFGRWNPAEAKTEKTGAVLRTSKVLAITFNPDRILQNVQHKNCRGETDLKLCRSKHRDLMSRF